jgi:hypothetical protein
MHKDLESKSRFTRIVTQEISQLCLDVYIGARYWIFRCFMDRIPDFHLFGWLRYSGYVLRLDIEEELCEAKNEEASNAHLN